MNGPVQIVASLLLALLGSAATATGSQDPRDGGRAARAAGPGGSMAPVEIRTAVSRTAVWVGDRVTYAIELRCAPAVDILLDDLLKERLRVDGGEILSADTQRREELDGRITHRVEYTLVTFRVDAEAIQVGAVPVRYYARGRGDRAGDAAPAGEVTIPPLTVAVGTTVPPSDAGIQLRQPAGVRPASVYLRLAQPVGLGLVVLAIVPAALSLLGLARRARVLQAAYSARRNSRRQRRSFDEIRSLQPESDGERVDAYGKLDEFVRDHLAVATGLPAHSLTPPDMKRALLDRAPHIPADAIEALLAACERARYAPDPPSAAEWAAAVREAEGVLHASRR